MTHLLLSSKLLYLSREEWDDSGQPRLGAILNNAEAVEAIQHHTVGADDDGTPNLWTDITETIERMRFLRTIRPDLGEDVPYSWVFFLMEPHVFGEGGMVVCEGRGPDRRGAHTKYHNRTGRAAAVAGNLEDVYMDLLPWVPQFSRAWSFFKYEQGLPNLGTVKPTRGEVHGHGSFPPEVSEGTLCPGQWMNRVLHAVQMMPPYKEDDDMVSIMRIGKGPDLSWTPHTFVSDGFDTRHVTDPEAMAELQAAHVWPTEEKRISWNALEQLVDDPEDLPDLGF